MRFKNTPEGEEVRAMLAENKRRWTEEFYGHDQLTGKGMDMHDNKCTIPDYYDYLRTQWLTDEVYNNPLYQDVLKAGSIEKYVEEVNLYYKDDPDVEECTEDLIREELFRARLSRDPAFAFYVCYEIVYKDGGTGPFILNRAQRMILARIERKRVSRKPMYFIMAKARQFGGSTLVDSYMSWMHLFVKEQWNGVVMAQVKDIAKVIKAMYTRMIENMPGVIFGTKKLQFSPAEGATDIYVVADGRKKFRDNTMGVGSYEKPDNLRGSNLHMVHFSEVAYWKSTKSKSAEDVITNFHGGMKNCADELMFLESTAKGNSGFFFDQYQLAKNPNISTLSEAIFIPFYYIDHDVPDEPMTQVQLRALAESIIKHKNETEAPDKAHESGAFIYKLWRMGATLQHIQWYITKRSGFTDHAQMAREAPIDDVECFVFSGNKVFNPDLVECRRQEYVKDPIFIGEIAERADELRLIPLDTGHFWVWRGPDKIKADNRYLITVDVGGRSEKADYCVITVLDRWPLVFGGKCEVVARWRGHIRYDQLADKAVKIARWYDNAMIAFESNTFDKKKSESSEFTESPDHIEGILNTKIVKQYKNLYKRRVKDATDIDKGYKTKIGFHTNRATKQRMVELFQVDFEDNNWVDHDERFYVEAGIYEEKEPGVYGNIDGVGNHDDIIMTDMIADLISTNEMKLPSIHKEDVESSSQYHGTRNESDI